MRNVLSFAISVMILILFPSIATAQECVTIQDGTLLRSDGVLVKTGYDEWGYNYQGRMFNGGYCDAYRDAAWCQEYKDINLMMKWNDAWLSNKDCDGDGLLDRHHGFDGYLGSGAWLTNHQSGWDFNEKGKKIHWNYFVKIVAAPSDAYTQINDEGLNYWYDADGIEIGREIWGAFAIVQQVYNDPLSGVHGNQYKSPFSPGFGVYMPKPDQNAHEE